MKKQLLAVSALTLVAAAFAPTAAADTVKLHGATTVINVVIDKHRNAVQQSTGHTLEIVGNATGKGLVDLVDGKADASLSSEPLEIAVAAAKTAGKTVDQSKLQMHEVQKDEIVFVVHPSNPVTKLSWEQLRDIHTGKITNWKDVGGKDAPINVYSDALTGGTRAMVKMVVMGGAEYSPSVRSLTSVKRVAELVARDPNGVGGVGKGFVDTKKDTIVQTKKLERPLGFVTIGAPSPKVRQVIEGFRAQVARSGG